MARSIPEIGETIEKRHVLLGVTGSVAAYKSVELARLLVSRGYEVRAIMTESAQKFISPLLLESITGAQVSTDFWNQIQRENIEHIELADWADVFVIAPATADSIAKLSLGFAESPLLATALATKAPMVIAPAMNVNMLEHPKTKEHLAALSSRGVVIVDSEDGELACGWIGSGRLAEPWEIFWQIRRVLSQKDLLGKSIVITTGPTREAIDPVRFISNRSSGKMGAALAREAYCRGALVTVIHGPCEIDLPAEVKRIPVISCSDMNDAVDQALFGLKPPPDVLIMAAAVADFRPKTSSPSKIKKSGKIDSLPLEHNTDILGAVGEKRGNNKSPILVGFAVETGEIEELLEELRRKLSSKRADIMIGNFAEEALDLDTNRVWIVDRNGKQSEVATTFKSRVANKILDAVLKL